MSFVAKQAIGVGNSHNGTLAYSGILLMSSYVYSDWRFEGLGWGLVWLTASVRSHMKALWEMNMGWEQTRWVCFGVETCSDTEGVVIWRVLHAQLVEEVMDVGRRLNTYGNKIEWRLAKWKRSTVIREYACILARIRDERSRRIESFRTGRLK